MLNASHNHGFLFRFSDILTGYFGTFGLILMPDSIDKNASIHKLSISMTFNDIPTQINDFLMTILQIQ